MNKVISEILSTGAVVLTAPVWAPYELVKGIGHAVSNKIADAKDVKDERNTEKEESNMNNQDKEEKENDVETLDLINPSKINEMKLFYPDDIQTQIDDIGRSLTQEEYKKFQKAMVEEGLGEGFIALFYGDPGTGKTESVLQIAKICNRRIFKVDMAEIQSMWIGATGHRVRQTFKKYRKYCITAEKQNKPVPILLLNEADALLGKRHTFESFVNPIAVQDNNQVQGILLEEFENNKGIIILTTNMATNLDSAFESRIFEKVHFTVPDSSTRKKIWKNKLPELDEASLQKLAEEFQFSGRDINQVVRNVKKKKVLSETKELPDFDIIYSICERIKIVA